MDKTKIDNRIDAAAEQAKETIDLLSGKIDQATQCADRTATKVKNTFKEGALKATDKIEEAVTAAADRIREKVR